MYRFVPCFKETFLSKMTDQNFYEKIVLYLFILPYSMKKLSVNETDPIWVKQISLVLKYILEKHVKTQIKQAFICMAQSQLRLI